MIVQKWKQIMLVINKIIKIQAFIQNLYVMVRINLYVSDPQKKKKKR